MLRGGAFQPRYRRRVAAHHEAGHLAAYLRFGFPFHSVVIDDGGNGLVRGLLPAAPEYALERSIICLSGPAAEARYIGVPLPRMLRRHYCRVDYASAERHLADGDEPLETALGGALVIVWDHWPLITRIADVLVEHGRLGRDEVQQMRDTSFEEHPKNARKSSKWRMTGPQMRMRAELRRGKP
jgi:hypothetical protein